MIRLGVGLGIGHALPVVLPPLTLDTINFDAVAQATQVAGFAARDALLASRLASLGITVPSLGTSSVADRFLQLNTAVGTAEGVVTPTVTNYVANRASGKFAVWQQYATGRAAPTVTDNFGQSPQAANAASKLSIPTGTAASGQSSGLSEPITLPGPGTYNASFWVKGLTSGQRHSLMVQRPASGGFAKIVSTIFDASTSGAFVDIDFTTTDSSIILNLGYRTDQGLGTDQTGGDLAIDMAQVTSGSGRKPFAGDAYMALTPLGASQRFASLEARVSVVEANQVAPVPVGRIAAASTHLNRPVDVPQFMIDQISRDTNSPAMHPHLGPYTHTQVQDGFADDPATFGGSVPHMYNPITVNDETWGNVQVGTAVINTAGYKLIVRNDLSFKDIHVGGAGTLEIRAKADGTRPTITHDTIMVHGTTLFPDRMGYFRYINQQAPGATARGGVILMGAVRMRGIPKEEATYLSGDLLANTQTFDIPNFTSGLNWQTGDEIMIYALGNDVVYGTDTTYVGPTQFVFESVDSGGGSELVTRSNQVIQPRSEKRRIVSRSGNTVTLDQPLTYDHKAVTRTVPGSPALGIASVQYTQRVKIGNFTSSITFESGAYSNLQKMPHFMAMGYDDMIFADIELKNYGRSAIDPSQARVPTDTYPNGQPTYSDLNRTQRVDDANNIIGNYAFHLHYCGTATIASRLIPVKRLRIHTSTALPNRGRGIVVHGCRAAVENCLVDNYRSTGIWWQNGNEIGQAANNTVSRCIGDGFTAEYGTRHEAWIGAADHNGAAYGLQARSINLQNNEAYDCNYVFQWLQNNGVLSWQGAPTPGQFANPSPLTLVSHIPSLTYLRDPLVLGGLPDAPNATFNYAGKFYGGTLDTYGVEQNQIPHSKGQVASSCGTVFHVGERQFTDRTDQTPMVWENLFAFGCDKVVSIPSYSNNYRWLGCLAVRFTSVKPVAFGFGTVSWAMVIGRLYAERYNAIITPGGLGVNYDGDYFDIVSGPGVTTAIDLPTITVPPVGGSSKPSEHTFYNGNDPWAASSGDTYPATIRTSGPRDSANFPLPGNKAPYGYGSTVPGSGARPRVYIDPSSALTLSATGGSQQIKIVGAIIDKRTIRRIGDWQSPESSMVGYAPQGTSTTHPVRGNLKGDPKRFVERNGCYNDSGTWKMRAWLPEWDSTTNEPMHWYSDVTLTGFDESYLQTKTVSPNDLKPKDEHLLEAFSLDRAYTPDLSKPVIVMDTSYILLTGVKPFVPLRSNNGLSRFTLSGADAAIFEIGYKAGVGLGIRYAGDAMDPAAAPVGNAADGYKVTVTATTPLGVASDPLAITLKRLLQVADDFARANTTAAEGGVGVTSIGNKQWAGVGYIQDGSARVSGDYINVDTGIPYGRKGIAVNNVGTQRNHSIILNGGGSGAGSVLMLMNSVAGGSPNNDWYLYYNKNGQNKGVVAKPNMGGNHRIEIEIVGQTINLYLDNGTTPYMVSDTGETIDPCPVFNVSDGTPGKIIRYNDFKATA